MSKSELLNKIDCLKQAVVTDCIDHLIEAISDLHIDFRYANSPILEYIHKLLVENITIYLETHTTLRVSRTSEYGSKTFDTFILKEGKLLRNGVDAKFSNIYKLYNAYKFIKNKR